MSSFIKLLLTEFGFLNPTPNSRPQEAKSSRSGQIGPISTSSPDQPTVLDLTQDRGELELTSGDAGSLPDPTFFTTLPKDMDGRNSGPGGTRQIPQDGLVNSQTILLNLSNSTQRTDATNDTTHRLGSHVQYGEATELRNGPTGTISGSRQDMLEAIRPALGQNLTIDETGQVSLPADDGMGWLRNKIHAIRDLDLNNNEKARMIHDLMTESYNSSRPLPLKSPTLSFPILNPPTSPSSPARKLSSDASPMSPTLPASNTQYESSFSLTPEDLQPTYVPRVELESPVVETGEEDADVEELDEALLGCQHYMRNVKLQCFTCKKWYTCRFCHDAVEDHHLIRRDTEYMLCMLCGHPQPSAQNCRQCGEQSAQYYCEICKLWDNDSKKSIYHCNDCGICRIGQGLGKDFFHCKVCHHCFQVRSPGDAH